MVTEATVGLVTVTARLVTAPHVTAPVPRDLRRPRRSKRPSRPNWPAKSVTWVQEAQRSLMVKVVGVAARARVVDSPTKPVRYGPRDCVARASLHFVAWSQ